VITPHRQAEAIATALGSSVQFHELTRDEAKAAMTRTMPAELADDTLDILSSPNPAEVRVSPDVQRVLGRAPSPTGPPGTSPRSAEADRPVAPAVQLTAADVSVLEATRETLAASARVRVATGEPAPTTPQPDDRSTHRPLWPQKRTPRVTPGWRPR
jgi:hypothetical protein